MNYQIENEYLRVNIQQAGAELTNVFNKQTNLEYMWDADPKFWGKTSPVLFPIVGTLKNDAFLYKHASYNLSRHGFARDNIFALEKHTSDTVKLSFSSTETTLTKYPFEFVLYITYTLSDNKLEVAYEVANKGGHEMLFSLGAHPAFKVPITDDTTYSDYYLEFNAEETAPRWPINSEGLIEDNPAPLLKDQHKLPLTYELFYQEALVFKNLRSDCISIKSTKHAHGLDFHFHNFPFMGIWAPRNADFVCIEPWCGIADSVEQDQQFETKEGIEKLPAKETWKRQWSIVVF